MDGRVSVATIIDLAGQDAKSSQHVIDRIAFFTRSGINIPHIS